MKRLLLLALAAVPLFATSVAFVYNDYDYYENDYWYDEYWEDNYCYDGYWVYYPHGYYCVHYVWWYPWWWDWYWYRCHWHHHFHWDFFYSGFYVVWYDGGQWWFRPRYGHWVRYKVPYTYYELRYRAGQHGINLPPKPPRELNIPYKESEVRELIKQNDPEGFKRIEKEHQSGNLEKMRKEYVKQTEKKIAIKNEEYKKSNQDKNTQVKTDPNKKTQVKSDASKQNNYYPTNKRVDKTPVKTSNTKNTDDKYYNDQKSEPNVKVREKDEVRSSNKTPQQYNNNEENKTTKKQTSNTERQSPVYNEKKEPSPQKSNYKQTSPVQKSSSSNENKSTDNYKSGVTKKKR
jgi:hypothetical protein